MAHIVKPPSPVLIDDERKKIFLAGSIEMGKADEWQKRIETTLQDEDIIVYNPRRDDWDSSLKQDINEPQFAEQVNWEMDALDDADVIAFYFQPETKSPISLLELGLYADKARTKTLIVCCPDGFWRKGNVDIVCQRYIIWSTDSFNEFVKAIADTFNIPRKVVLL